MPPVVLQLITNRNVQELQSGVPGLPGSSSTHSGGLSEHFPFARALAGGPGHALDDVADSGLLERVRRAVGDAIGAAPHALAMLLDAAQVGMGICAWRCC